MSDPVSLSAGSDSSDSPLDLSRVFIRGLLKDTAGVFSKWYNTSVSPVMSLGEDEDISCTTPHSAFRLPHSAFRLHEQAENCGSSLAAGTASIILKRCRDAEGDESFTGGDMKLTDLPVGVLVQVLSFLDAHSLCRLGQTCRQLQSVAGDHILWRRRLQTDVRLWHVLGHLSHPKVYHDASSDLTEQEM